MCRTDAAIRLNPGAKFGFRAVFVIFRARHSGVGRQIQIASRTLQCCGKVTRAPPEEDNPIFVSFSRLQMGAEFG